MDLGSLDMKLVYLYLIGVFLSTLFFAEKVLTDAMVAKHGIKKVLALVFINSAIGGFVMVPVYYGLDQFFPGLHEYFKVGISGMTAMLGKDMVYVYRAALLNRFGGKNG